MIDAARSWWARMMRTEYESSSVFTDLALQMRQIDAPIDVQSAALRMAHEELRHAELCGTVLDRARRRGGDPGAAGAARGGSPRLLARGDVLRNVIYGCCLGETVNAARLAKWIAQTRDPFIRETFRQLAADERFHAQFGYFYLETQREWLAARPEVRQSIARYLRYAFANLEQHMGANPANARPPTDDERAIGLPDLTDLSATFQETILNACIPGLERFGIDASSAWRTRTATKARRPRCDRQNGRAPLASSVDAAAHIPGVSTCGAVQDGIAAGAATVATNLTQLFVAFAASPRAFVPASCCLARKGVSAGATGAAVVFSRTCGSVKPTFPHFHP